MKAVKLIVLASAILSVVACDKGSTSYSLLEDGSSFQQNSSPVNTKVDVLWVIDNSGSMQSSQNNLAANFPTFINSFVSKGYDFQLGVTTTDAFLARPEWTFYYNMVPKPSYYEGGTQAQKARFRDGVPGNHSGFFLLTPSTPNLAANFVTNVTQGVDGAGDERSLQSMETALLSQLNAGFIRQNSFLSVIILTDEDDFSHPGTTSYSTYNSNLTPISSYVSLLENLTGSSGANRRFSVNTISVNTQTCLNSIYNGAQKIGQRVGQLADATGGIKGNICGDFAEELDTIAESIVQLSTQFYLGNKKPIPSTIVVKVNGVVMPNVNNNPANDGGWSYNAASNSIVFQGQNYVPPQGATITVTFDPESLTF